MTSYELSISPNYVPTWGVVEAVREFFQNALDEETRDPNNKMFFTYDPQMEMLRIGNKHSKLDAKTLLFGYTEKSDKNEMIGSHGEGYKIATVVLLRLNKQIEIYNYGCRQVWHPRFVKSRKYGTLVPTFFVDNKHVWEKVPDNDLVVEISGITQEEYDEIAKNNLHIIGGSYPKISTSKGDLLTSPEHFSKIFVGGLFICSDPRIKNIGVDFHPDVVRLERDRTMVNSFDVQWTISSMIGESGDRDLINDSLSEYTGAYIRYYSLPSGVGDEISREFLETHGYNAMPVSSEEDGMFCASGNIVIVSQAKKDLILESSYYKEHSTAMEVDETLLSSRVLKFANKVKRELLSSDAKELAEILRLVRELEAKV